MNKRIIISIIAVLALLVAISVALFLSRNGSVNESTGGSGQLPVGHLILSGYNTPSNGSPRIELGSFLTSRQQASVRTSLEAALFKADPKREYRGNIISGTVTVDDATSVVSFGVEINDPKLTYKVSYNTVNDQMVVFDSKGEEIAN